MTCTCRDCKHGLSGLDLLPEEKILIVRSELNAGDSHVNVGINIDGAECTPASRLLDSSMESHGATVNSKGGCGCRLGIPGSSVYLRLARRVI
jgi:hypothetical protein